MIFYHYLFFAAVDYNNIIIIRIIMTMDYDYDYDYYSMMV